MDWIGVAALATAILGGTATLVVALATLIATLRGNRVIGYAEKRMGGRLDELLDEVRLAAYAQGVEEGRRRAAAGPPPDPLGPAASPPAPGPPPDPNATLHGR